MIIVNLLLVAVVAIALGAVINKVVTSTKTSQEIIEAEENELTEIPTYKGVDDRQDKLFQNN